MSMNVKSQTYVPVMLFAQTPIALMNVTARKVTATLLMDVKISMNARLVLTSVIKPPPNVKTQMEATTACVSKVSTRSKTNVLVSV